MKKGSKASDELRQKLSEAHKGKPNGRAGKTFVPADVQRAKRIISRKAWTEKNREKLSTQSRNWKAEHREQVNAHARERYHKKNKNEQLIRHRKRKYGMDESEYRAIVEQQEGRCLICGDKPNISLSIDHNHVTGQIRGLICNPCNIALSKAKESPEILRSMAQYLEKFA